MKNAKTKHLQLELETWIRTLDYIQHENVFLKNNLTAVIRKDIDNKTLEQAEHFQGLFVNKDAVIALLRYDIAAQGKYTADVLTDEFTNIIKRQDRLRTDMEKMEKKFSRLKIQFNKFIGDVIL